MYSRSTLLLELSRVTALQGRVSKAHEYLNQASRIIYENRHKRYSSYLNFRYAYHAYLSGKFEEALNLLSAAQTNLDERVDRLLQIKILDLEQKVRLHAGVELEDCHLIESAKIKLSKESGNFIATRILARKFPHLQSTAVGRGEDPIGDLIDRGDMVSLINAGILTPIRETLGIPSGEKLIVLNVLRDTSLIVDKADIRVMNGMTKQLQAILLALSSGAHSKEQLIWKVWGYMRYDPLRHDPPLFQAIARLRNLMNPQKDWVLNTDEGYALSEGVGILMSEDFRQRVKPLTEKEPENDDVSLMVGMSRLQLARRAFGTKVFTTQQYKDVLGVSKATACRDIKDYIDARMVDKIGNGKQSVYLFI